MQKTFCFGRIFFAVACFAVFSIATHHTASGQFDIDGERWNGNTAQTQGQGFSQGDPLALTWGFAAENMSITGANGIGDATSPNVIRSFFDNNVGDQATVWQPLFSQIYNRWGEVSGLDFQFEANDDGATWSTAGGVLGTRADLRISAHPIDGQNGSNVLAYNYFPNSGDMVIDSDNTAFFSDDTNNYRGLRNVLAHELGHGLGMAHLESANSEQLMEPFINTTFDGPQYFDILAAQRAYGDANEKSFSHLGNDVVARATALGDIANGDVVSIGQDANTLVVDINSVDFVSIDDSTDVDIFSFGLSQSGMLDVELEALGFTFNVGTQFQNNESPFDTLQRSDLALELLDTDGVTILASVNANGLGGNEFLSNQSLDAGTYFLRVSGQNNGDSNLLDTQFFGLTASFTAVPEPSSAAILLLGFACCGIRRNRRNRS